MAELNRINTGYTIQLKSTSPAYLSSIRAKYESPNYLSPAYYNYVSRYSKTRRIQGDDNEIFHETYNKYIIPQSSSDKFITVDHLSENRLDVIANVYYQSPGMWWVIAIANNIIDPFQEVPYGTVLRLPSISNLYGSGII